MKRITWLTLSYAPGLVTIREQDGGRLLGQCANSARALRRALADARAAAGRNDIRLTADRQSAGQIQLPNGWHFEQTI